MRCLAFEVKQDLPGGTRAPSWGPGTWQRWGWGWESKMTTTGTSWSLEACQTSLTVGASAGPGGGLP